MAIVPEARPIPRGSQPIPAGTWLSLVAGALLFAALALGLVVPKVAGAAFLLLALLGLIWLEPGLLRGRLELDAREKLLLLAVVLYVGVWLLSWLGHGLDVVGRDDVGRTLRLLLIIPIYLFLRRIDGIEWSWWWGMAAGAFLAGAHAIAFALVGAPGEWADRVGGTTNPIYFGGIALALSMMLLPRLSDPELPVAARVGFAVAVVMGLVASASSGSRGAWLGLPVLLLLYMATLGRSQQRWMRFGVPLIILAVAVALASTSVLPLAERFASIEVELAALARGESATGTLGRRVEMWWISLQALPQHWLWGGGPDAFHVILDEALRTGQVNPLLAEYEHPHNQFLSALLIAGLPGLLALVLLLGIPVRRFLRLWRTGLVRTRMLGWCGLAAMTVLIVMCLSESIFQRNAGIVWFALLTAGSSALVHGRRRRDLFEQPATRVHSLSVIMICRDEADRIERGLASVAGWADEVIVLDSGSTDGTVEICRRYATRVEVTDWPGFGPQKQRALDRATGDWVLSLDADEEVSDELRREIDWVLSNPRPRFDGYCLPWAIRAFGGLLQFGHWARAPMRLFRRGSASFTDAIVHEKLVFEDPGSRAGQLEGPLFHDVYRDLPHARAKLDAYARLQARQRAEAGRRATIAGAWIRAAFNLIDNYLLRAAFLDGRAGWLMARLHARYTYDKYAYLARGDY